MLEYSTLPSEIDFFKLNNYCYAYHVKSVAFEIDEQIHSK